MIGAIKHRLRRGIGLAERILVPPATLPVEVLASRVVLVGASVSTHWNVEVRYPCVSLRPLFDFDKTPAVDELLAAEPRPDAIILKECAAYFPGPLEPRKPLVVGWIDRIAAAGVVPILATVVPVTAAHARGAPGRLEGILEFNEWAREVAKERSLPQLDLEAALRVGLDDPHLDPALATRDGLHLRREAYRRRLDPILAPVLVQALGTRGRCGDPGT
jgi:hypothetical protein